MAFNGYLIAEAYATLGIDTRKFDSGLNSAGMKWARFTAAMNAGAVTGFGPLNSQLLKFNRNMMSAKTSTDALTKSMNSLARAATAANRALGGRSMNAYLGGIKAWGTAVASIARGVGAAFSSAFKGFGSGIGSIFGGLGKGIGNTGSMFSGVGSGISSILRGLGSGIGNIIRSSGMASATVLRGVSSLVGGVTRPLMSLIGSVKGLAIGGLIATGIGGFGAAELVKNSSDMELAFARIRRAAEFTDGEFVQFRKDISTFGSYTSGIKMDDLFGLSTIGAKMGIAGDALNLFTRDMAKVRIAIDVADLPTEELAERIGSLISVFHRGNDEAIRFASALNALDLKTVASARDILDVSGRMSGTASLLGMKPQEVLALSAALRQARVPIETAGTAMQQIMGRMASRKDSPQFARIAGMKEKPFLNLVGSDPLKAIIKIEEGLQRLDKITAIRALDQLGLDGQRVRGTLLQLGTVLPQLNDYVKVANTEWTSLNSIMKSNEIIGETLHAQWMKVSNGFSLTADVVGQGMLPIFKELATALEYLMRDIRESFEKNKAALMPWFSWIRDQVSMIGVIWRSWPDFMGYANETLREKLEQAQSIFRRFMTIVGAYFKEFGADLGEYFSDLGKNIAASINNAIPGMPKMQVVDAKMGGFKRPISDRAGDVASNELGERPAGRAFSIMDNLPNRKEQKEKHRDNIRWAMIEQKRENREAQENDKAQDEEVRRRAEMMRAPVDSKPGKRRRGADLSVLRPAGFEGIDFAANARRKAILDRNDNNPNIGVGGGTKPGALFGPGRNVLRAMDRARLAVPLRLRGGEFDPTSDFMGPRRAAVGLDMPRDLARRVGRAAGPTSLLGRQSRAGNAAYREWRNRVNAEFGRSGRRTDGAPAGGQLPPGTREKEKGVEDVLTEAKKQTDELREIKLALNDIKNKPNTI